MIDIIMDLLKTQQDIIKEIQTSLAENHAKEGQIMNEALALFAGMKDGVVALETLSAKEIPVKKEAESQSIQDPASDDKLQPDNS